MEDLWHDIRYGSRMLVKNPGFTLTAIVVLGLGIGANSTMFSLVNTILFRPLAVEQPRNLVGVYDREAKPEGGYRAFSYPDYCELRDQNDTFDSVLAFTVAVTGLTEGDTTRRVFAAVVSANYFSTFGVRPVIGRGFRPEEEQPGSGTAVTIVSHSYWKRIGLDPGILGRTLTVNGRSFEVIGVAPQYFSGTTALFTPDLWVPLGVAEWIQNDFTSGKNRQLDDRQYRFLCVVGRLKTGLDQAGAQARLAPLADRRAAAFPRENAERTFEVAPLPRLSVGPQPQRNDAGAGLAVLVMPMSGVVLLIACSNLANMLLARGAGRRREMSVRLAVGGSRGRILRQLMTEGLMLSLLGGVLGLVVAYASASLVVKSFSTNLPFMTVVFRAGPDLRVLGVTFALCLLSTLLFAFLPAWRLACTDLMHHLKEQTGEDRQSRWGSSLLSSRNLLVMSQVALSLMLLVSAGLFVRGAHNAAKADPGFRFDQNLVIEMDASLAGMDEQQGRDAYRRVVRHLPTLPGVESVGLASMVPFGLFTDNRNVLPAGVNAEPPPPTELGSEDRTPKELPPVNASYVIVDEDYFRAIGLPLLRGRSFDAVECGATDSAPVAIVDQPLAQRLWPDQDPLGRQLQLIERGPNKEQIVLEVVGLVPGLRQNLSDPEAVPHLYVPFGPNYQAWMNLHVRITTNDPDAAARLLQTVRSEVRTIDSRLPILSASTLRDFHQEGLMMWFQRAGARVFLAFALLALFLSAIGVYGVKAYLVARRTREIGIRLALGASRGQVLRQVLRDGLKLTLAGLGVGLLLALAAGHWLSSRLHEVSGGDPIPFLVAILVLGIAALLASYVPARRAAAIQPTEALRYE